MIMLNPPTPYPSGFPPGMSAFIYPPTLSISGTSENRVTIQINGYWKNSNILGFTISNATNTANNLTVDPTNRNSFNVNVLTGTNSSPDGLCWTVDMGQNPGATTWNLPFNIILTGNSGSWVFVKSKVGDDDTK